MSLFDETRSVERPQFFMGQTLEASDLDGISDFHRAMRWLHNRSLHQVGIGNGLTMPSANAGAMSVRPELAGSAAGLAGAITIAGGAALSSITGALMTDENATYSLFSIMLLATAIALLTAMLAALIERRPRSEKEEIA